MPTWDAAPRAQGPRAPSQSRSMVARLATGERTHRWGALQRRRHPTYLLQPPWMAAAVTARSDRGGNREEEGVRERKQEPGGLVSAACATAGGRRRHGPLPRCVRCRRAERRNAVRVSWVRHGHGFCSGKSCGQPSDQNQQCKMNGQPLSPGRSGNSRPRPRLRPRRGERRSCGSATGRFGHWAAKGECCAQAERLLGRWAERATEPSRPAWARGRHRKRATRLHTAGPWANFPTGAVEPQESAVHEEVVGHFLRWATFRPEGQWHLPFYSIIFRSDYVELC
jgi:hypothetical protein